MRRSLWYLALLPVILMACKSTPPALEEEAPTGPYVGPQRTEPSPSSFTVTQEMYDSTLMEVKAFIEHLNSTIHRKYYDGWKSVLSDEYFNYISSAEFLANASESPLLRSRKIVLKTLNDYFTNVVVPSRSNSKVDEIEFTDTNTVKVYYIERRKTENNEFETRRLRLYELIKTGNTWKIIG
jgi:hypothetical protein